MVRERSARQGRAAVITRQTQTAEVIRHHGAMSLCDLSMGKARSMTGRCFAVSSEPKRSQKPRTMAAFSDDGSPSERRADDRDPAAEEFVTSDLAVLTPPIERCDDTARPCERLEVEWKKRAPM